MEEFNSSSDEEDNINPVSYDSGDGDSLAITEEAADQNYEGAGLEVPEEPDQLSLENNSNLLCDKVNSYIMELLDEIQLPFMKLADFQLLSLHVLGSKKNLVLISPTGSGKVEIYFSSMLSSFDSQLFLLRCWLFNLHHFY